MDVDYSGGPIRKKHSHSESRNATPWCRSLWWSSCNRRGHREGGSSRRDCQLRSRQGRKNKRVETKPWKPGMNTKAQLDTEFALTFFLSCSWNGSVSTVNPCDLVDSHSFILRRGRQRVETVSPCQGRIGETRMLLLASWFELWVQGYLNLLLWNVPYIIPWESILTLAFSERRREETYFGVIMNEKQENFEQV